MTNTSESKKPAAGRAGRRRPLEAVQIALSTEDQAKLAELHRTYTDLKKALADLRRFVVTRDARRPALAFATARQRNDDEDLPSFTDVEARARAGAAIEKIYPEKDEKMPFALRVPGLLAAGPDTLAAAAVVNAAKAAFKAAVLDLPTAKRDFMLDKVTGRSIHLKQAYRAIPVLERKPVRVSFSWALNITENIRMTKDETLKYLAEKENVDAVSNESTERLSADREKISKYPDGTHFVRIRPVAAHPRANVLWPDETASMLHASLPFLYPDDAQGMPEYVPLQIPQQRRRARRTDRKARTAILPFWGIYVAS